MKVGLIRHFKVDYSLNKGCITAQQFAESMSAYDKAPVIKNNLIINENEWDICFCSTLPRAVETARFLFKKEIILTDLLCEVPLMPFTNKKYKLPSIIWHIGGRIAWYKNKSSQPETFAETSKRIDNLLELLKESRKENILLVSHGFFMRVFTERIKKLRFQGYIDRRPRNAKLYTFTNV